jgi:hypothetical protein
MTTPKLGVLLNEEKALSAARETDPVALVILRSTLINPPRAAAARALAERVRGSTRRRPAGAVRVAPRVARARGRSA